MLAAGAIAAGGVRASAQQAPGGNQDAELVTPPGTAAGGQPAGTTPRVRTAVPAGGPVVARPVDPRGQPDQVPVAPPAPGAGGVHATGELRGDVFRFGPFTEPIDLFTLVEMITEELGVQILATDPNLLEEKIVLTAAVDVPLDELLAFLSMLLEQKQFALTRDVAGIYVIRPTGELGPLVGLDPFTTTRLIPTSGIRPSTLQGPIQSALQPRGDGGGGQPGRLGSVAYLDDLGLIVVTDSPRRVEAVQGIVDRIVSEQLGQKLIRLELKYLAAPVARERILALTGQSTGRQRGIQIPNLEQQGNVGGITPGASQSISNLQDRLSPDPSGNALIFRGRADEEGFLRQLIGVVDVPSTLVPRWYGLGSGAQEIAEGGRRRGLGAVIDLAQSRQRGANQQGFSFDGGVFMSPDGNLDVNNQRGRNEPSSEGGPAFMLDADGRGFIYYGTPEQHLEVARLVEEMQEVTRSEGVMYEFYKLKHANAEETAEIIQGLLNNQVPTQQSDFLPGTLSRTGEGRTGRTRDFGTVGGAEGEAGGEGGAATRVSASTDIFVLADKANNQVVVKAPRRLQPQFARLIERLDLRRPQVFVDVKIVALTAGDQFRLAFEQQFLAGEFAFNSNFGLGSIPGQQFDTKKNIATDLAGLTTAFIKSKYVPLIINAIAQDTNAKIMSTPQLLVNDNEEAEIVSLDQQPTTTTSQGQTTTETSFGGYEEAGTTLKITPQISEGGYMRLAYEITLSSFTGSATTTGNAVIPPPRQENTVRSESVTVPTDATIVVGGIVVDSDRETIVKIPLLGDIPILGLLFRDTNTQSSKTTLYVFITPTILRDPTFADLRLLTRGPAAKSGVAPDGLPPVQPESIEVLERILPPDAEPASGTGGDAGGR